MLTPEWLLDSVPGRCSAVAFPAAGTHCIPLAVAGAAAASGAARASAAQEMFLASRISR